MRDVEGSDKRYGFLLPPADPESSNIACFEAPIDALSHQTLCKQGFVKWDSWRLSLSGGSLAALTYFLDHHPNVVNVFVCTDLDEAGERISDKIWALKDDGQYKRITVRADPPSAGNDWNDALMIIQKNARIENRVRGGISI